ncbi:hypothetical protein K437DRAFT_33282 [Tilletiaria anomala UBC 951]|uniref:Uncharacterized protein n=1 Tax=Tilletiaria anomala (strain ATCC 24038 / CBS 436.72 / UBC 951) TaxID=1037660 RepID=A0A066WNF0_TILAU|nr:uncharacterized protein K437DRAFT_33282 [Tilletiaria anomala UBC 951]KDN52155.1 hypothetical protein K437DRAFT_33282 [Tilletiaria anomala UBC 951]
MLQSPYPPGHDNGDAQYVQNCGFRGGPSPCAEDAPNQTQSSTGTGRPIARTLRLGLVHGHDIFSMRDIRLAVGLCWNYLLLSTSTLQPCSLVRPCVQAARPMMFLTLINYIADIWPVRYSASQYTMSTLWPPACGRIPIAASNVVRSTMRTYIHFGRLVHAGANAVPT